VDPTQVPLSDTETVLIGLAVSAVVLPMGTWRLVEHFNTMAHEGMHGAVGALSGGTVRSITKAIAVPTAAVAPGNPPATRNGS
jgi:hypothetical protein